MRKNYALLKQCLTALTLLIAVSVIIYSCKKGDKETSDVQHAVLRQWYQNNIVSKVNNDFTKLSPLWESTYINKQAKYTVYEIAFSNPSTMVLPFDTSNLADEAAKGNLRLLLFEDNNTRQIKFASYMYIENQNKQTFGKLHYKRLEKLNGKVIFYHQNGEMANGWVYENGKAILQLAPLKEAQFLKMRQGNGGLPGQKLMIGEGEDCRSVAVETFFYACVGATGHEACDWQSKGMSYITICRPTLTLGNNETTIDYLKLEDVGGEYWPPVDCNGDENGTAIYTEDCGCIGGNTGIESCGQKEIIDSLRGYPCAQKLLKKAPNLTNKIALLIKKTFNNGMDVNLKFTVDNTLKGTTVDGKASSFSGLANGSVGTYTIGINPDVLNNATQEYILVTLYHEALHAYFEQMRKTLTSAQFTSRFGNLASNGGRTLFREVNGHFEMGANNFLLGMRDAIIELNGSFNLARAYALAKGGVVLLNANDKTINEQERDVTKTGYTGTKCP